MGIFDRIQNIVGDGGLPEVRIETTEFVGRTQHADFETVDPGRAIEVPVDLTGGGDRLTVDAVEVSLVHVSDAGDRTTLLERRIAEDVVLDAKEERRLVPTVRIPGNAPKSGRLPSRIRTGVRVDGERVDEFTGYLDIGPNPLLNAVRTELRVLGFTLSETSVYGDPTAGFWPDGALDEEVLRSMEFVPSKEDGSRSPFTLVPVVDDGDLDCYLTADSIDGWRSVTVEDPDDPTDELAGTLERLGLREV